jgi:phage tail-like protein
MADDGCKEEAVWPMPKFCFEVDFGPGSQAVRFQEVSGLDFETQPIDYRSGNMKIFSTVKMPGLTKSGAVTMKKAIFVADNAVWDWFNAIKMNTIERRTVSIRLLDEHGKATMTWRLKNAFPTKITGTDLKTDGNEVAIESIEIANEQLVIENGG